jgi:hypothetical protein
MNSPRWLLAVLVAFFCSTSARAQAKTEWDAGYPKTGSAKETIAIKGKVTLDKGWVLTKLEVVTWIPGKGKILTELTPPMVNFGPVDVFGVESGSNHIVQVVATVTDGKDVERIPSKVGFAVAK